MRKEHRLRKLALEELREIAFSPLPASAVHSGAADRLLREGLIERRELRSPYKRHCGATCPHWGITELGRQKLTDAP